jgi:NitT/TauT family transport system substrate-binding protein
LRFSSFGLLAVLIAAAVPSAAQVPEIRLARQFSMGYLQFNVMEHERLIEKHARALGLPQVTVSWVTFNGPAAVGRGRHRGRRDARAAGAVVAHQGHAAGGARHIRHELAALPAQYPQPRRQDRGRFLR